MDDIKLGHRIYYFVNPHEDPYEDNDPATLPTYSTEAHSAAEAQIILGKMLHVTALSLIDVTDYSTTK